MQPNASFGLLRYLRADLHRFRSLCGKPGDGGLRFWLTALSPRFTPVLLCRLAHAFHLWGIGPAAKLLSLLNFMIFGIEIATRCPIGQGLFLPHTQGTVIGAARIGRNCTLFQGVTLGAKDVDMGYNEERRPILGDDVMIGAGAKVLGGITMGDGSKAGANAVVVTSVPPGVVVVGIPAKPTRAPS